MGNRQRWIQRYTSRAPPPIRRQWNTFSKKKLGKRSEHRKNKSEGSGNCFCLKLSLKTQFHLSITEMTPFVLKLLFWPRLCLLTLRDTILILKPLFVSSIFSLFYMPCYIFHENTGLRTREWLFNFFYG